MVPMIAPTDKLEKRLAQLKKEVPSRGIERHPSILKGIADLPGELRSSALSTLASDETVRTIIAFPPQIQRGWHYVPKQALLFTPTGAIHITASIWPDQEPELTHVNASGLLYLRVSLVLLHGFLEIVAQGTASPARLGMEFNTVAWERLSRPLRQLLAVGAAALPTGRAACSPSALPAFEDLPLKFSNGVRIFALLPGEELEDLVFQPGLWNTRKLWPFIFRKPVTADTLLTLTSNFMVVIQEELGVAQGWIVSYIPRKSIVEIRNQPRGLCNELSVQLEQGNQAVELRLPLKSEAVEAWHDRWIQHGGRWQDLPGEL
jgi:hypothetical protein